MKCGVTSVKLGWHLHQLDVKNALLQDNLHKEVYTLPPSGFVFKGDENKVFLP